MADEIEKVKGVNFKLIVLLTAIIFSILGWTTREVLCHFMNKPNELTVPVTPVQPEPNPKPRPRPRL